MGRLASTTQLRLILFLTAAATCTLSPTLLAQADQTQDATATAATTAAPSSQSSWLKHWLRAVDEARANQPHYTAPIVTTHVILVQQYRYDLSRQEDADDTITANFGASRGLEIIPTTRLEIGFFPPPYFTHQSNVPNGIGDLSFQVKYRASSATEGKGDYFIGVFFGGSFPTGRPPNGADHLIWSPTFGVGKGLGPVDIQTTLGAGLPGSGIELLGRTIVSNTAVEYRIKGIIWPMLELNSTFWFGGNLDGEKEVFVTPGLVVGSFQLVDRLHIGFGAGVQLAVSQFRRDNHRWIGSIRLPF